MNIVGGEDDHPPLAQLEVIQSHGRTGYDGKGDGGNDEFFHSHTSGKIISRSSYILSAAAKQNRKTGV